MNHTKIVFVPTYKKKPGKIKVICCLIAILAIGLFWYQKGQANPPLYGVAIFQSGGIDSKKLEVVAYTLKALDSEDVGKKLEPVEEYAGVYFDKSRGLWAYCRDGYGVIDAGSSSGNSILDKPITGNHQFKVGMEIIDQPENALQIACKKL